MYQKIFPPVKNRFFLLFYLAFVVTAFHVNPSHFIFHSRYYILSYSILIHSYHARCIVLRQTHDLHYSQVTLTLPRFFFYLYYDYYHYLCTLYIHKIFSLYSNIIFLFIYMFFRHFIKVNRQFSNKLIFI